MATKVLCDEELDKVTGGCVGDEGVDTNNLFTGFISMDDLLDGKYFYQEYYFVEKTSNGFKWFKAKLFNSYTTLYLGEKSRLHDVYVSEKGTSDFAVGKIAYINAENYAVYTTKLN